MSRRQNSNNHQIYAKNDLAKKKDTKFPQTSQDKSQVGLYIKDHVMIDVLKKKGVQKLFPIQYETFNFIMSGKDVTARDRTGSGKTLGYSLPIITKMREQKQLGRDHTTKFLIVLPTRELAIQVKNQIESLRVPTLQNDFRVYAVYGGSDVREQLAAVQRGIDIIVGTPGRLMDFINRGAIQLSNIKYTCLDEADEMLNMGFKQDIEKIFLSLRKVVKTKPQNLLFSATMPDWIWSIAEKYQEKNFEYIDMIKDEIVKTSKTVEHYSFGTHFSEKQYCLNSIISYFLKNKREKRIIIFCETKREVERLSLSSVLTLQKKSLHGDVKQFIREKVIKQFRNAQFECLIATNVAARGLDFPTIDLIIQMEPPKTTDTYIHRSGRTGRAGNRGICVTLFNNREQSWLERIEVEAMIKFNRLNEKDIENSNNNGTAKSYKPKYQQKSDRQRYEEKPKYQERGRGRYQEKSDKPRYVERETVKYVEKKEKFDVEMDY